MPLNDASLTELKGLLGEMKMAWVEGVRMLNQVQGRIAEDVPLTAAQLTAVRAKYDTWKTGLQTWYGRLP